MPSQLAPCPLSLSSALSPQVRTIVNLSPSTTRPPWCACPQTRTPSPRRTSYRLQPPPPTVIASTAYGYSLHRLRIQPPPSTVTASTVYGYSLHHLRLQPSPPVVTASTAYGHGVGYCSHCSRICPPSSRHAHCVYRLLCLLVGTIVNLCRPLRRARSGARAPNRTRAPRDTSCLQPVPVHTASPARASLARLLHGPFQHAQPSPAPPLAGACRRSSSRVGRPLRRRPARRRSARRRRLLRRAPSFPGALTLPAGRGRPCAPPPSLS